MMSMEASAADEDRKASGIYLVYIAYFGSLPEGEFSPMSQHLRVLDDVLEGSSATDSLIRSYKRSFNGFAAKLTEKEREKLANKEGVVSDFENKILKPQTTRSWDFMGFSETARPKPALESDVIVGVFDTGIWPESQSFSDKDFGPPPEKWKDVIGAGIYNSLNDTSDNSVRDRDGHGSHTASIAAGNNVENTNVLAAYDDAISDGIDIISASLGFNNAPALHGDPITIGAFHAMARGLLTVNSAGNRGPTVYTIDSVAPWLVSVAASTTDRKIIDRVVLGNGKELTGCSFNYFIMKGSMYPIVYRNVTSRRDICTEFLSKMQWGSVCGGGGGGGVGILLCDSTYGDDGAHWAGAAGTIKLDGTGVASIVPLPTIALNQNDLEIVQSYYSSTNKAEAKILKSEAIKDSSAPVVASFSSRGPNPVIPEIMKPDITAPGVDILAAYSPIPKLADNQSVQYNILSGTSMSCPHVAGVAAYVKSVHPAWSASAIQSALMTTAQPMEVSTNLQGVLDFGSGHVNPVKATSSSLVYETSTNNYTQMLCNMGYNTTLKSIRESIVADHLASLLVSDGRAIDDDFPDEDIVAVKVKVNPSMLSFKLENEKKSFVVIITRQGMTSESLMESRTLVWFDGTHTVKGPIIAYIDMY
ncbi:Subtilisin-like protease SBT4.13 [Vitis vinifera]|uniref:Subtilisin-like protease SBT4.13 n=1 Tax=Vitis vinifera TaxID=29760 RepID=A0A438G0V6_VITVI|nr:Subtilisin-like protease SBT4.13 [Vitis vinifera]